MKRTLAVLALALASITLAACSPAWPLSPAQQETPSPSATPEEVEPVAAPEPAYTPPSQAERLDETMKSQGYEPAVSGNVYIKFAGQDDYTCGYYDCIGVHVWVEDGCPSMLYVEANIMSGDTVVGMTNNSPGAVAPESPVAFVLEDVRGQGDSFRISKVTCY